MDSDEVSGEIEAGLARLHEVRVSLGVEASPPARRRPVPPELLGRLARRRALALELEVLDAELPGLVLELNGTYGVGVSAIAREAGVSRPTVYKALRAKTPRR